MKTSESYLPEGSYMVQPAVRQAFSTLGALRQAQDEGRILGEDDCPCGRNEYPRINMITGRSDDMVKVKGCNFFPAQVEECLAFVDGCSSEYQIQIEAINDRDVLTLFFETALTGEDKERCEKQLAEVFKAKIGCTPNAEGVPMGELPRSTKKTQRVFDSRY